VQIRVKAPDATKVRLNFWSGPKLDMEKQQDGFWTITTPPLVPGFHYYTLVIDGAEINAVPSLNKGDNIADIAAVAAHAP
jgi:enterochelin esterase family protein